MRPGEVVSGSVCRFRSATVRIFAMCFSQVEPHRDQSSRAVIFLILRSSLLFDQKPINETVRKQKGGMSADGRRRSVLREEAASGDPALRRAQTRQSALNFRNFRNLEVTSDAVRPVMAVYWGCEAMTLIVCHDCTCVAAGSPVMHSFCGLLGPGTSPKCA